MSPRFTCLVLPALSFKPIRDSRFVISHKKRTNKRATVALHTVYDENPSCKPAAAQTSIIRDHCKIADMMRCEKTLEEERTTWTTREMGPQSQAPALSEARSPHWRNRNRLTGVRAY
ncbi:uncharacterized protein UMAG_03297 [Mycosarcoma maydis]|uniref:Uncharacterized protein n=1 Tax=Mycosarcoma maydis TaxID=5270 RepID=A0A0D1DWX9_MYCMD|nr:uncharacterized protein UMAG_03297 [Ustilago maydis 521]KIS68729.1 hypothetical protein UMAG_03297 [Ustilago maydis 521]|eukprot:XP_011389705.1 hypothetical protein UMAG_03297 [Ustilago maydis 521]